MLSSKETTILVREFYKIKDSALQAGAISMSFSGSGPSIFSFTETREEAERVSAAMQFPLLEQQIVSDCWISKISERGAHVVEELCAI